MKHPAGILVYDGLSELEPQTNILAIITGFHGSSNQKTGNVLQLYIINKDKSPLDTLHANEDSAICGDCPLRGHEGKQRRCYVRVDQGPSQIYKAYLKGNYPSYTAKEASDSIRGRKIRLGAYGDPAALPVSLLQSLVSKADAWTGYTHQARSLLPEKAQALAKLVMGSADSRADRVWLKQHGFRTFRVLAGKQQLGEKEILCPATTKGITCDVCKLCNGKKSETDSRADIAIHPHGGAIVLLNFKRGVPIQV